jgi:hypothetical protein
MSERKDERWLDDELRRVVNTTRPEFDDAAWKEKYAREYETLLSRKQSAGRSSGGTPHRLRLIVHGPIGRLAVAASIILVVGLFLARNEPPAPKPPTGTTRTETVQSSPARIVSMISLSTTFRQGGMEALDKQFDRALDELGPRPNGALMADLLSDLEG